MSVFAILAPVGCPGLTSAANAQCELQKVAGADAAPGYYFGDAIAADGGLAVIGARGGDSGSGAAYIFSLDDDGWIEETKLIASDGETGDDFGWSVDIRSELVIAGAYADDDQGDESGSAYIFRHVGSQWNEEAKLTPSDGDAGDWFGFPVALGDDIVVVGAIGADDAGPFTGCAYVFRHVDGQWLEEARLAASDAAEGDWFGRAIAVSGDAVIIGAPGSSDNGPGSGSCYVFRYDSDSWYEEAKLTASDAGEYDGFGNAISLDGDTAAIGAVGADHADERSGAVYIFQFGFGQWQEVAELHPDDAAQEDAFGSAVDLRDDVLLAGAYRNNCFDGQTGSAYVFRHNGLTWEEDIWLIGSDGEHGDWFGANVAIGQDHALIGAPFHHDDTGAVYVFPLELGEDCNDNLIPDSCDIIKEVSLDSNDNGIPDECECLADVNQDEAVDIDDLYAVLAKWGLCEDCPEDVDGSGLVDIDDVFAVLGQWGPCP